MPELPEVEVLRRDLDKEIVGKKIKSVEVTGTRSVRRHRNKKEFIGLLEGRKITSVQRRGKYLILRLDGAEALDIVMREGGRFDLLLTDIKMPLMDGIALALSVARDHPRHGGGQHLAGRRLWCRFHQSGDAEIGDDGCIAAALEQNVLRLDVAMDYAAAVSVIETEGDRLHDARYLERRESARCRETNHAQHPHRTAALLCARRVQQ